MAVAYRDHATAELTQNGVTISVSPPSAIAQYDLWIIAVQWDCNSASDVINTPAGFTPVTNTFVSSSGGYPAMRSFWRIAGADEVPVDVTLTSDIGYIAYVVSAAFSGTHQTTPIGNINTITNPPYAESLDAPDINIQGNGNAAFLLAALANYGEITRPATTIDLGGRNSGYAASRAAYELRNVGAYSPGNFTWIGAANSAAQTFEIISASAPASLDQEGFRWRDDDGNEAAASWLAAQDAQLTRAISTNTRLRALVNATGDPAASQFQLEWRLQGGTWRKVR